MTETRPHRLLFWRTERGAKFAREVGSVVLGVLIALGFGAIATEVGWWFEVRTARHAMKVELGELIGQGDEREKVSHCVEHRLDQIAGIVDAAEKAGKLPPLGSIQLPPWRTWPRGIWASTQSAQTAAHLDRDLLDNYSSAYEFADQMAVISVRELDVWTRLSAIVGPGGRSFSNVEAIQMRNAIGEARMLNRMMGLNGIRLKQIVVAYDLGYEQDSAREYSERPLSAYSICKPIGSTPPAMYGQAPFDDVLRTAHKFPITRKDGGGQKR
ncbi:hypothetical protein P1X14_11960 [Sphingomonas sp. AOB5]|uniref:hypothetical protein n=1 Tax=Sphingomonas sp. AOB5 TaxID=3034017 RepID=UPI0023F6DA12|nr:hypothetical protein [Sphingomonas sp. AOB5]MDF7775963.1 hypothetical protein [Sphingomonas sp. AOB5]